MTRTNDYPSTFDNGRYTKTFDGEKITGNALGFAINYRDRTDDYGVVLRLRSRGLEQVMASKKIIQQNG